VVWPDRVSLHTADRCHLPFSDHAFDLVVSSLAIHTIRDPQGRESAITEVVRVLKSGGRVAIANFREPQSYGERLRALGMHNISLRPLGCRFWYSGLRRRYSPRKNQRKMPEDRCGGSGRWLA
jgi:arsenite methyltransferase